MSDPEAVSPVGDYLRKSVSGILPSLINKLDLRRQLGTIKPDLEKMASELGGTPTERPPAVP